MSVSKSLLYVNPLFKFFLDVLKVNLHGLLRMMNVSRFIPNLSPQPGMRLLRLISPVIALGALFLLPSCVSLSKYKADTQTAYDDGYESGYHDCDMECLALQQEIAKYINSIQREIERPEDPEPPKDAPWLK